MTPEALAKLHAACFVTPRPWSAAEIADLAASPLTFVSGDVAGFVMGRVIADEAELLTSAVAPEARRRGRGAALLAEFEATARARGAATAFLEVAADNAAALALYLGAGWQRAGRRRGYYRRPEGTPVDAEILSKALP